MRPSQRTEGSKPYYFATKLAEIRAMEAAGQPVINLGIGSPDMAPPVEALHALIQDVQRPGAFMYQSYRGLPELREAVRLWYAEDYRVTVPEHAEPLLTQGSKEALHFVLLAYLNPGEEVLVPNPGYPAYPSAAKLAGGRAVPYDLDPSHGWLPQVEVLNAAATERTRVLMLNYPHMPTGAAPDLRVLEAVLAWAASREVLVVHDNPYSHTLSEEPFSLFQCAGSWEGSIELNSLSKSASMAGGRLGLVLGSAELLAPAFTVQSSFSSGTFRPLQRAAIAALQHAREYRQSTNAVYRERKAAVHALFDHLGCAYDPEAQGLFVWAEVPPCYAQAEALSEALLQQAHVFMPPGHIFGSRGARYLRASLCQPIRVIQDALTSIQTNLTQSSIR